MQARTRANPPVQPLAVSASPLIGERILKAPLNEDDEGTHGRSSGILTSTLSSSSKPKASTLRPLDFDLHIRAPQQYLKTRVYNEGLAEEAAFLLAAHLASAPVHASAGFPEATVPTVLLLRKAAKGAAHRGKEAALARALVERVEESARWAERRRAGLAFAPARMAEVERWEADAADALKDAPLARYVKVQRKAREKRRQLVEKVRL